MNPRFSLFRMKSLTFVRQFSRRLSSTAGSRPIRICVVGSGPAGFYTSNFLLQKKFDMKVDMYEKSPVPFGLVRYGVAPDHPEIKNVITSFSKVGKDDRFTFIGNVTVGKDLSLSDLQKAYHAIVLCYGSAEERKLGIPNEDLVVSAHRMVGWYNGVEDDANLALDLDIENVAIIGHGNVALDISRILLMPLDRLQDTDISLHAFEVLSKSKVKSVHVIGRRGPLQISFTIKELREVINLHRCLPVISKEDFTPYANIIPTLPRPRKRLMELMNSSAERNPEYDVKDWNKWHLMFHRSPLEIIKNPTTNKIEKLKLGINQLKEVNGVVVAEPTGETEDLPCQMVVRSVGYKGVQIDPAIPFDSKRGIVPNEQGKVTKLQGVYCTGWIKTGPVGVIASTVNDSIETAQTVARDIETKAISVDDAKHGKATVDEILRNKGISTVSFDEWEKIDKFEVEKGKELGKCREKIVSKEEMLKIAKS